MRLLLALLVFPVVLVMASCYTTTNLILRNPDRPVAQMYQPLDSPDATLEDSLTAEILADSQQISSMPPGEVQTLLGGDWIFKAHDGGPNTIKRIFYDGGRELEVSGYLIDGDMLHLSQTRGYNLAVADIALSRIDSVEVRHRHPGNPSHFERMALFGFAIGVGIYLVTADKKHSDL